jgi:hypothetical protein
MLCFVGLFSTLIGAVLSKSLDAAAAAAFNFKTAIIAGWWKYHGKQSALKLCGHPCASFPDGAWSHGFSMPSLWPCAWWFSCGTGRSLPFSDDASYADADESPPTKQLR